MSNNVSTKPCCACGQSILVVAQRCRHCKAWQSASSGATPSNNEVTPSNEYKVVVQQPKSIQSKLLLGFGGFAALVVALLLLSILLRPSQSKLEQAVANDVYEHHFAKIRQATGFIFGDAAEGFVDLLGDFAKDEALKNFVRQHNFDVESSPFHTVLYMSGPGVSGWKKVAVGFFGMAFTFVDEIDWDYSNSKSNGSSEQSRAEADSLSTYERYDGSDSVTYESKSKVRSNSGSTTYTPRYEEDEYEDYEEFDVDSLLGF